MAYRCFKCGKRYELSQKRFRCDCGGFLEVEVDTIFPKEELDHRDLSIWRYREAFGLPEDVGIVSLGEGNSPIVRRGIEGESLFFKLDYMQPSGSFKDRGASVLMSLVKSLGVDSVVEDSSGNAGAAVSAYATAAGIGCTIFVPDYTPEGKLVQIGLYGSTVVKVPGKRQDANYAAIDASMSNYYASHLWNPFFPIGIQSSAFEIWEAFDGNIPECVIVPVGSGGYLEGLFLGFKRLKEAGYAKRLPRIIGVQAEKCSPIHSAFVNGLDDYARIEVDVTVAEGIAVGEPPRAAAVLSAVRESGGKTIAVSDEEIISALTKLFKMGFFVEPTSASVLAAWYKLDKLERKNCVLILTGSGLKEVKKLTELFIN